MTRLAALAHDGAKVHDRRVITRLGQPVLWGILLPPIVFFGWMLWGPLTLGNDYPTFQVRSALSLRFYDTLGLEPMWYPHLGGGIPIGGLMLGQYFHLPAWLTSHLPGFWTGQALALITARQLLLFALLHAAFYRACRKLLGWDLTASYLLSFILTYNARTLDAFRYGPGLDVATYGQCAVLLALAHFIQPSRGRLVLLAILVQLVVTAGYPVLIPLFAVAAALVLALLLSSRRVGISAACSRGAQVAGAAVVGLLLASPAIAAIADFVKVNQSRVAAPTIEWATAWSMTGLGPLQSALAPWTADVNSSFGASTLITLVLVTLVAWAAADLRRRWAALVVLAFPFLYAFGAASPVYRFFFRHVPGFASLRVPGRMLSVLPLLIIAVLLWARQSPTSDGVRRAMRQAAWICALASAVALVLVVSGSSIDGLAADLSPLRLAEFWTTPWEVVWLLLAIVAAMAFALVPRRSAGFVLVATTMTQTGLMMAHGTWVAPRPEGATYAAFAAANQLPLYGEPPFWATNDLNEHAEAAATVAYSRFVKAAGSQANCYLPIDPDRRKRGVLLPFYLSTNLISTATRDEALAQLKAEGGCRYDGGTRTLATWTDGHAGVPTEDDTHALATLNAPNQLMRLQPNRVRLAVAPPRDAVLVTPFPDTAESWSGAIDGHPAAFLTVNGGFLGLRVPAGSHVVDIQYFSRRMQSGWRLFLATAVGLLAIGALATPSGRRRWITAFLVVATASIGAVRLDRWYSERATADVLLPNDYADLLKRQIARWEK